MTIIATRQRLEAEAASLEGLLASVPAGDILGRLGFESQLKTILEELRQVSTVAANHAEIALIFGGKPVSGSQGILASFGMKAVESFQRTVSTTFSLQSEHAWVGERGPISQAEKAALSITGVVHGSFGFVLEEIDPRGSQFIDSALKLAVDEVNESIRTLGLGDEEAADETFESLDTRQLSNLRDFTKLLSDSDASLRLSQPNREFSLDAFQVRQTYERISGTQIKDDPLELEGLMQGILPETRRFELRTREKLVKGKISRGISEDYLKNLEIEPLIVSVTAHLVRRTVTSRLRVSRETYTLLAIVKDGVRHPPIG